MNQKSSYFLLAVVILVAFALVLLAGRNPAAPVRTSPDSGQAPKTITVTGEGIVRVKPDQAQVALGVQIDALTAREAQENAAQAIDRIVGKLLDLGIERGDIQTSRLSLEAPTPLDFGLGRISAIPRFRATNQVAITVRNLKNLGRVIDEAVAAGANQVEIVIFTLAEPRAAQDQALDLAVKDARHKADQTASASGVRVRSLRSLNVRGISGLHRLEETGGGNPGSDKASIPVDVTDLTIRVLVEATFDF